MPITSDQARQAVEAAQRRASTIGIRVTVAVVDEGGYLILLSRMDGAPALSPELAEAKAAGAAVMCATHSSSARVPADEIHQPFRPQGLPFGMSRAFFSSQSYQTLPPAR